jgi:hypothetical protein
MKSIRIARRCLQRNSGNTLAPLTHLAARCRVQSVPRWSDCTPDSVQTNMASAESPAAATAAPKTTLEQRSDCLALSFAGETLQLRSECDDYGMIGAQQLEFNGTTIKLRSKWAQIYEPQIDAAALTLMSRFVRDVCAAYAVPPTQEALMAAVDPQRQYQSDKPDDYNNYLWQLLPQFLFDHAGS